MSEQNLLDCNIYKQNDIHNSFNGNDNLSFSFDYAIAAKQKKANVTPASSANSNQPYATLSTFPTHTTFFLPPINSTFLQPPKLTEQQQWKHEISQGAIIINEKIQQATIPSSTQSIQPENHTPTHIVSPEAIREALQEEKEEAMGKSDRRPFSQFSSFHALKQRRYSVPSSSTSFSFHTSPNESKGLVINENNETPLLATHEPNEVMTMDSNLDSSERPSSRPQEKLKRPPNAYLLFNRDVRGKLLSSCEKMTVAEISKEVGDGWKALPDEQKERYIKEASLLKEEHLKKYPGLIYSRRTKTQLAEDKKISKSARKLKADTDIDDSHAKKRQRKPALNNGQRDPRGRKKKRQRHPFAPKHPMSAYLYYLASVYPKVSSEFPGSTVGPISKSISKTWHAMSPEERLPWTQKAEMDKERYAREMRVYMANIESQANTPQTKKDIILPVTASSDEDDDDQSQRTFEGEDEVGANALEAVVNMLNNNSNGNIMYTT